MAKQHRLRVIIGHVRNKQPIIKQVAANSEIALADKAIRAIIDSGRIKEFLQDVMWEHTLQAIQNAIPKLKDDRERCLLGLLA